MEYIRLDKIKAYFLFTKEKTYPPQIYLKKNLTKAAQNLITI